MAGWVVTGLQPFPRLAGTSQVHQLRERTKEVPDEYFVCLVGALLVQQPGWRIEAAAAGACPPLLALPLHVLPPHILHLPAPTLRCSPRWAT